MVYKTHKNIDENKRLVLVFLFILAFCCTFAQSYENQGYFKISATRFSLPANHSGLTDPAFIIWGKFTKTSIGDKYYLYLRVRFEHSAANNPNPSFWYSYRNHNGKIYTDKEIGTAPFQSIRFLGASFNFKVSYGINTVNITMNHDDYKRMGEVSKDFDINSASVFVEDLVWYNHEAIDIKNAIATYENAIKKKEEEVKKAKEAEERKKQEEAKQLAEEQELLNAQGKEQTSINKDTATGDTDDFWSDSRSRTNSRTSNNENVRSASQFGGGLDDIEEGGYFKDDKGNYYKKEGGNARIVNQSEYDRAQGEKVQQQFAQQEQRRQEKMQVVDEAIHTGMDILTTSFYTQQMARGVKDATQLSSDFESVEELNAAFSQQLKEITYLSQELKAASVHNMNTYTTAATAGATTSTDHAYATALSVFGSVAASISADKAEKKAREELSRQRSEAEAEIKERQRKALVAIRDEISKVFPEGGMPLSSHKVDAPILYLFAYSANKTAWEKDQDVPLAVSNVIPIYRYNDGTYPYTSNVKRTFESGGIENPTIIGYFTDKRQAEKYRKSLLEVAPNARFAVNGVEIKVKEKSSGDTQTTNSDTDFWGNKKTDSKTNNTETELDFWGVPVKKKGTETKKTEQEKQNDFWNN